MTTQSAANADGDIRWRPILTENRIKNIVLCSVTLYTPHRGGKTWELTMSVPRGHPGPFIRDTHLKPSGKSVTEVAKALGISRPAASNFLNGKAAASPEMATRLERVFGVAAKTVLDMQAAFDAGHAKAAGSAYGAISIVPPFQMITANQIEDWADRAISARIRLSVLLRTLVHSTGIGLTLVNFPGNDDAERPGWDGRVEASEGTPWVPSGLSGWEFGVNVNVKDKADGDFTKSVKAVSKADRARMSFVFVTPRRWHGKDKWAADARAKNLWRTVQVLDSADLEQWLAQSLPAQAWLASELKLPTQGVRSLDQCWFDWSEVARPALSEILFSPAVDAAKRIFSARLSQPPQRPIVIAADSVDEALAFLGRLFAGDGGEDLATARDRVLVFDEPSVLPRLALGTPNFIPVAASRSVEQELASLTSTLHSIVVCPRNATNAEPDFILEPVDIETFDKALTAMGKSRDAVARYAAESGRSLTVLRRRLSTVPAVKTPEWAADAQTTQALMAMMFVGAWNSDNPADRLALELLAARPYEQVERDCQRLTRLNDAPMWSIAHFRGVVSKLDLLFAIAGAITRTDLERYFDVAKLVLGEDDPALDLPEDDRWWAAMRGKVREFSGAFRRGICETLVLLAVNGDSLFKARIGFDCRLQARLTIRALLPTPLMTRALQANDGDLPTYAEAAPDEFLSLLEQDLRLPEPAVIGLLKPAGSAPFSHPSRTGLLWALEGLAWNPETLPRTASILARLAEIEINDNWANKPISSLEAIFRAWMPQTAADIDQRLAVLKSIANRFPAVGWSIAVDQFSLRNTIGHYSHKPRWRPDAFGFGEPVPTTGPIWQFQREMVELALSWPRHTVSTLSDLVERVPGLDDAYQQRIWNAVAAWGATAQDHEKAALREAIRVGTLSYGALRRAGKRDSSNPISQAAKDAYAALEPQDILNRHQWLFDKDWLQESYDEIHSDTELDFEKREERVATQRSNALREILDQRGLEGLIELAKRGESARQVGWLSARRVLSSTQLIDFARYALQCIRLDDDSAPASKIVIKSLLHALEGEARDALLGELLGEAPESEQAGLLGLAPFAKATWQVLKTLNPAVQSSYWRDVAPGWLSGEGDAAQAVTSLIDAGRPRAAFACISMHPDWIGDRLLFRLLEAIAKGGDERSGEYALEQYRLHDAFKIIDRSANLTLDQKAGLEFAYLDALIGPGKSEMTPNLDRHIELHPDFFVHALVWAFKRKDGGVDPPSYAVPEDRRGVLAGRAYSLLDHMSRLPGHNDLGQLEVERLRNWVDQVRAAAADLDRTAIADQCIGKIFARSLPGSDSVWPCEEVRDVMEAIGSVEIARGAQVGKYNLRGVHSRGPGGGQERAIAEQYRHWAQTLRYSHPFVSETFLMGLVKSYEAEAEREDVQEGIRRRLE